MTTSYPVAFTAPHYAASQAGQNILEQGGSAIEAMVAAAASISVVYPHMNSLGADGFWLISEPDKTPIAIDACGVACARADLGYYQGHGVIPSRGAKAALTMAGAVAGWQKALDISHSWQPGIALCELLAPAIGQAKWGIEVTQSLQDASEKTFEELSPLTHFEQFMIKGKSLKKGKILKLPAIARTLTTLSENGLDDFYHGVIARSLAEDLQAAGSPITLADFNAYQAQIVTPLCVQTSVGKLFNLPAPTQGIASLIILALFDRLQHKAKTEADFVHLIVECTKQAFLLRNSQVTDPSKMTSNLENFLTDKALDKIQANISMEKALPWPHEAKQGDTIWMGACDDQGRMVSYIQSIYWEFGSAIVSPQTGIVWNNRGTSFSLTPDSLQQLTPGLKPFHTLNPAYGELNDGRRISYGTMGGEGQPQTQAAIFARYVYQQKSLVESISLGRWLLGRTWGEESHNLKIESDLAAQIQTDLVARGHDIATVSACNELMGHAGAVVIRADKSVTVASDPRSDGRAIAGHRKI
ncbi:MAG: gamma-glutamyltranspeptidase [Paraglaciecola sp.]|jgi:gamma-glutamyltranspeptidase